MTFKFRLRERWSSFISMKTNHTSSRVADPPNHYKPSQFPLTLIRYRRSACNGAGNSSFSKLYASPYTHLPLTLQSDYTRAGGRAHGVASPDRSVRRPPQAHEQRSPGAAISTARAGFPQTAAVPTVLRGSEEVTVQPTEDQKR